MSEKAVTRKEIFMAKAAGEKAPDITPVTREEIFLSRIAGGGGGGGGADVLNADGVIKQEHLPEGFPYKTESIILPECQPMFDENSSGFAVTNEMSALNHGDICKVLWNGVEYTSVAQMIDTGDMQVVAVGNMGAIGGAQTSEPFFLMAYPLDDAAEMGVYAMLMPLDGSTEITISISAIKVTPLSNEYIKTAYINAYSDDVEFEIARCDKTYAEISALVLSGVDVVLKISYGGEIAFGRLVEISDQGIVFGTWRSYGLIAKFYSIDNTDTWYSQEAP